MKAKVVEIAVTSDSLEHIKMLDDHGMLVGPKGKREVNPAIRAIVDAFYNVLAGGKVAGTVPGTLTITMGNSSLVKEFQNMENKCMAAINEVNHGRGEDTVVEV